MDGRVMRIKEPLPINYKEFISDQFNEVKYGLPKEIRFCKSCVESNQRPSTTIEYKHKKDSKKEAVVFDKKGVCSACNFTNQKDLIDWNERDQMLRELCDKHRRNDGRYDCIVPGSGGKDSIYVSHLLKTEYGMHPLTVTWSPHIYTEWGRKNFDSWIHGGQDNMLFTPNGKVHRLLTRLAVDQLFHPFQPFILGQKSLAPKIAALTGIPLIFYGEHEAEYGSRVENNDPSTQDSKFYSNVSFEDMHLSGTSVKELIEDFGIDKSELQPYMPADQNIIDEQSIEVRYFGYYKKWHPQGAYYYAVENSNFNAAPERTVGTYSKYSSIDDKIDDFHYYTTGIKFGRGRATEDASQEIRSGEITREEGVSLVKRFDLEWPDRFSDEIFQYLSIPKNEFKIANEMFEQPILNKGYFTNLTDSFRSPHIWKRDQNKWALRNSVYMTQK
jgi:N-acetyl sugar amidotransferase